MDKEKEYIYIPVEEMTLRDWYYVLPFWNFVRALVRGFFS